MRSTSSLVLAVFALTFATSAQAQDVKEGTGTGIKAAQGMADEGGDGVADEVFFISQDSRDLTQEGRRRCA